MLNGEINPPEVIPTGWDLRGYTFIDSPPNASGRFRKSGRQIPQGIAIDNKSFIDKQHAEKSNIDQQEFAESEIVTISGKSNVVCQNEKRYDGRLEKAYLQIALHGNDFLEGAVCFPRGKTIPDLNAKSIKKLKMIASIIPRVVRIEIIFAVVNIDISLIDGPNVSINW